MPVPKKCVPKKRAARQRKRAKVDAETAHEIAVEVSTRIGAAVKNRLQALAEVTEDLSDAVDALHDRVEALEALQGIFPPTGPQAKFCDCENCRLRWN